MGKITKENMLPWLIPLLIGGGGAGGGIKWALGDVSELKEEVGRLKERERLRDIELARLETRVDILQRLRSRSFGRGEDTRDAPEGLRRPEPETP